MFPAITESVKGFLAGFGSKPIELGLKETIATWSTSDWKFARIFPNTHRDYLAGYPAWSGESVTRETALRHSVVFACYRLISEAVGFLPLLMLQSKGDTKLPAATHPMFSALKNAPNDEMTAMTFRETRTGHCLLDGNGYALIDRRRGTGTATGLQPLKPEEVHVERDGKRQLVYVVKEGNSQSTTYTVERGKPHDILHIRGIGWDGICGYSVIEMGRQSMGTALAAERNVARFWAAGGRVPYHLELAQQFKSDQEFEKFRADWERIYSEPHRAPILQPNIAYKPDGLNARDAQVIESREFSIPEICRWFAVSPHLVGDLSRATFSNIEHLALQFVKMTLAAWLTRWEQELWRCVLTDAEKAQGYFFRHNVNALLRGDFQSRIAGYAQMLQNGIASQNEVRDLEDWNPFDGGDDYHIQLNMQTLPGGTPTAAQAASLMKIGSANPKGGSRGK